MSSRSAKLQFSRQLVSCCRVKGLLMKLSVPRCGVADARASDRAARQSPGWDTGVARLSVGVSGAARWGLGPSPETKSAYGPPPEPRGLGQQSRIGQAVHVGAAVIDQVGVDGLQHLHGVAERLGDLEAVDAVHEHEACGRVPEIV